MDQPPVELCDQLAPAHNVNGCLVTFTRNNPQTRMMLRREEQVLRGPSRRCGFVLERSDPEAILMSGTQPP